jgi:hypothetical protein
VPKSHPVNLGSWDSLNFARQLRGWYGGRQMKETAVALEAFRVYRNMGPERSTREVARKLSKSASFMPLEERFRHAPHAGRASSAVFQLKLPVS